ncbi:hypothetical protein AUJ59_04005 [Candidatus Beckwithbacteria bacterium CG1_02_47_37]|uniref:HicB-like antitoxin of toxin-antitoxin system domain-containing protein n=2 Tax=Candidatus Beckwithiibacteriota TaxID=1752726 RepID=A0A1J4RQ34_9BACT|nr:MAG: hypothetical protein AUJ59_04005 [Candidatus Beckwithbacteria bacterium CG1_02_47_37]
MAHQKTVLDYRVILKPDKHSGSDKPCYSAFCPTLGLVDDGDTPEEALKNIKNTIRFHLQCLQQENKDIPADRPNEELITITQVPFPLNPLSRLAI